MRLSKDNLLTRYYVSDTALFAKQQAAFWSMVSLIPYDYNVLSDCYHAYIMRRFSSVEPATPQELYDQLHGYFAGELDMRTGKPSFLARDFLRLLQQSVFEQDTRPLLPATNEQVFASLLPPPPDSARWQEDRAMNMRLTGKPYTIDDVKAAIFLDNYHSFHGQNITSFNAIDQAFYDRAQTLDAVVLLSTIPYLDLTRKELALQSMEKLGKKVSDSLLVSSEDILSPIYLSQVGTYFWLVNEEFYARMMGIIG